MFLTNEKFNINEQDIIGNQAPFDFDVSVKDIYSAISVGATLVIIPRKYFSKPVELLDFLCEKKITTIDITLKEGTPKIDKIASADSTTSPPRVCFTW